MSQQNRAEQQGDSWIWQLLSSSRWHEWNPDAVEIIQTTHTVIMPMVGHEPYDPRFERICYPVDQVHCQRIIHRRVEQESFFVASED